MEACSTRVSAEKKKIALFSDGTGNSSAKAQKANFHPLLWDEAWEAEFVATNQVSTGRLMQVWFASAAQP